MEIRKVQKTGDMHYVYLPTAWCKKHNITSNSKVSVDENSSGALTLNPKETKAKIRKLDINLDEDDQDIINKIMVGCYLNPLASFRINLKSELDVTKLLSQKNIISLESVEIDENVISSDSSVIVTDPDLLLRTMVKKIKNLVTMMSGSYNKELILRYEEEIDRTKMLIEKSIINYMTLSSPPKLKMVDLYYISLIVRDLERMVDHLINLDDSDHEFIGKIGDVIIVLKNSLEQIDLSKKGKNLDLDDAILYLKKVKEVKFDENKDKKVYDKRRISSLLSNVSEVLIDWGITNRIED